MNDDKEIVEEFAKLCIEAVIAHRLFTSLFEGSAKQRDLFQSIAPYMFGDLCSALHQYVILQFAKLTDPAKSGRRKTGPRFNLTSNYILEAIAWPDDIRQK